MNDIPFLGVSPSPFEENTTQYNPIIQNHYTPLEMYPSIDSQMEECNQGTVQWPLLLEIKGRNQLTFNVILQSVTDFEVSFDQQCEKQGMEDDDILTSKIGVLSILSQQAHPIVQRTIHHILDEFATKKTLQICQEHAPQESYEFMRDILLADPEINIPNDQSSFSSQWSGYPDKQSACLSSPIKWRKTSSLIPPTPSPVPFSSFSDCGQNQNGIPGQFRQFGQLMQPQPERQGNNLYRQRTESANDLQHEYELDTYANAHNNNQAFGIRANNQMSSLSPQFMAMHHIFSGFGGGGGGFQLHEIPFNDNTHPNQRYQSAAENNLSSASIPSFTSFKKRVYNKNWQNNIQFSQNSQRIDSQSRRKVSENITSMTNLQRHWLNSRPLAPYLLETPNLNLLNSFNSSAPSNPSTIFSNELLTQLAQLGQPVK